jgi:hypothetical protein
VERDERVAQERLAQPTPVLEQAAGEKESRVNVAPFHPDARVAAIAVSFMIRSVALAFPESEVSRETKIVMAETSSAAGDSRRRLHSRGRAGGGERDPSFSMRRASRRR